ncbi:MAG: glycosyltransferase family 4 protein [Clostridia bacterium]|jgi:spore coat protein SA|nr:glycosyltransferase family 4 protein [Clostridia bacterium]
MEDKKKDNIAMITSGFLPIPATKGGAVENLIVNILEENEVEKKFDFTIFSVYDEKAIEEAKQFENTKFIFIRINLICKWIDKVIYWFANNILKKKNSQSYRFIMQRLHFLNQISKNLKKNDYDKVLLENHPSQYLALKWRKNDKKYANRYFYHCHNEFSGKYGCDKVILETKKIICVSNYIKKALSSYLEMKEDKFTVLRNCVNEQKFSKTILEEESEKMKQKYGIQKEDIVFIFTGRIVPEKGVLELVKAVKQINHENFKLLILGSALNGIGIKNEYEENVKKNLKGIEDKIIFTGFINYNEIPKLYQIADVAVIPSIWNDPAPLTVIESITCGLPIITTKSGGIPEYANENCAILLERDDELVNNLAKAMEEMKSSKAKRESMAEESRKLAKELTKRNYYLNFVEKMSDKDD